MTSKFAYISLLVFMVSIIGCKKDKVPCTSCPTGSGAGCEDIQNVKHFFYFKVGSWWVYEEENSGLRDSVYVTSAAENPSNYDFDVEVYSTHQDYYYRFWPQYGGSVGSNCSQSGQSCGWCISVFRSKYKPGDFVGEGQCFIYIPKLGARDYVWTSSLPSNYIEVTQIDSVYEGIVFTFDRTIRISELNTYMEGDQPTNHFFSENIGLVKKELLDSNQVWNLVDYYIQE